ncbi:hypothetical protein [Acetoanaerobium sticklandii]
MSFVNSFLEELFFRGFMFFSFLDSSYFCKSCY